MNHPSERVAQLSPVKRALLAVEQAQAKLEAAERARTEPIAVVGMGCRFPGGADSPAAFWRLLREGVNAVTEVPADRWSLEEYFDPSPEAPGKMYTRWGAFVGGVDRFDPAFFGIAPREAVSMDPQQRLLMEVTWEALENAGQDAEKLAGSRTGVFVGVMNNEYFQHVKGGGLESIDAYYGTGNAPSAAAGRLSYALGFNGPSMTVDTACSASLVATHLACQSLRGGESDLALAGGVNLILLPDVTVYMCRARTMAADGLCKTFDASADGYVRGEGCGVVVLKRLSDALRDGDDVLAVIRGSAVKHDGRGAGFTVPSGAAQQEVIREALAQAKAAPSEVTYVEAHGTGTPLGDPIEFAALGAVLGGARRTPFAVGSVKTNVGHLESAAGIAGLIKTVLALKHGEIPPHLHLREVNPQISLDEVGAYIPTARTPWQAGEGGRRLAGVSSFGLTGTIAHAVLEEAPAAAARPAREAGGEGGAQLLAISARDERALAPLAEGFAELLEGAGDDATLADICHAAGARRTHHEHRLALTGRTRAEVAEALRAFVAGGDAPSVVKGRRPAGVAPGPVFVFPGQGSQWVGMGRRLLKEEPAFRRSMERCDELIRAHSGWSLLEALEADESRSRLGEIDVVQPSLFAVQVSLAALWRSWGVEPGAVVGQSMGEVAAAHVAGALTLEDAARVICRRSSLLRRLSGAGSMAAVELTLEEARAALEGYAGRLSVAVSNSHVSTVVAGETAALESFVGEMEARGVYCRRVKVDIASHSPQMEPLREELLAALDGLSPQAAAVPIYSTVTGELGRGLRLDADYWWRNLREPVLFSAAVARLAERGHQTFIELSPHPILLSAIQQDTQRRGGAATLLPSLRRGEDERGVLLSSLAGLYAAGRTPDWRGLFPEGAGHVLLPNYAWQRSRYWVERGKTPATARRAQGGGAHPLLDSHVSSAQAPLTHLWELELEASRFAFLRDHRVQGAALVPAAAYVEMVLGAAAQAFGGGDTRLASLELRQALFVPEEGARLVQLTFSDAGSGETAFNISSRREGAGHEGGWALHATGLVAQGGGEPSAEARAAFDAFGARGGERVSREDFYARLEAAGYSYGPAFRTLDELTRVDGEALARLDAPARSGVDAGGYVFHPALLDGCLQLLAAAHTVEDTAGPEGAFVPVGVGEIIVKGRPAGTLRAHARLRDAEGGLEGDVLLLDEGGGASVEFRGVRLQSLATGSARPADVGEHVYELEWQEQEQAPADPGGARAASLEGGWLIFADGRGVGLALAGLLGERGARACVVSRGDTFERTGETDFRLDPARAEDVRSLFESLSGLEGFELRGVVHLGGLDLPQDPLAEEPLEACLGVVHITQALAAAEWRVSPRLWVVSRGAQAVGGERKISITQSPLWGLGRTAASELPGLFGGLVDLEEGSSAADAARLLCDELETPSGEQQVAFRGGRRFVARLERGGRGAARPFRLRADASYLITGGLGALGLQVARWMVEQGARRLVLMGRTPLPPRSAWKALAGGDGPEAARVRAVRELEALGAGVHVAAVDAADGPALASFLAEFEAEGWPEIRGVVHAAGLLRDRAIARQDADSFRAVWLPKVAGAWLLHELLPKDSLDFFVLFSSAASLLGSPGQANYAAANAFLDALARQRDAQGLPALSINWGAWDEVGLAASAERGGRLAQRGFRGISPREGLEALSRLVRQGAPQAGVIAVDWPHVARAEPGLAALPFFSRLTADARAAGSRREPARAGVTREIVLAAAPDERARLLAAYLRETASRILGAPQAALDPSKPLNLLGLDSLMGIELKNSLETHLGVLLPMAAIMQGPSLDELAARVLALIDVQAGGACAPAAEAAEVPAHEEAERLLSELDELSSEDVDRLLAEMLA